VWQATEIISRFQEALSELSETLKGIQTGINPETQLDDLREDSLDVIELVMALEDEFNVVIPEDDYERLRPVGDVIRYIERQQDLP